MYLLFESASGYGLFEHVGSDEIGSSLDDITSSITDLKKFSKIVKMKAFKPYDSAETALDNINHVSQGEMTEYLSTFLEMNLSAASKKKKTKKDGKKSKVKLGVVDPKLGGVISEMIKVKIIVGEKVQELLRGIREHFCHYIQGLNPADLKQAQLGLGHSYSRCKVKFNVHRVDNMIIQSIALLDQLDKDLNTFSMRVREWYGWHFPELAKVCGDPYMYARLAKFIQHKEKLSEDHIEGLEEITMDAGKAKEILSAARMSMGTELNEVDMLNVTAFAERVMKLSEYRKELHLYLQSKMSNCAPNLSALVGEQVGARLISHAGSLINLAKLPASTVQILGAEKALFRAMKTKGNTPKYGLIFHSTFIGRAAPKNKGRISRHLANKCSIATRIDAFEESRSSKFGEMLREQVEERLEFYKTGKTCRKNVDVMTQVAGEVAAEDAEMEKAVAKKEKKKSKKSKKRKASEGDEAAAPKEKKSKKDKKKKKAKKSKA